MDRNQIRFSLILMFLMVARDCDASLLAKFRKLAVVPGPNKNKLSQQVIFFFFGRKVLAF